MKKFKEKYKITTEVISNGKIESKTSTILRDSLIDLIATENSFDDAWYYLETLFQANHLDTEEYFNVYPNTDEVREILENYKVKHTSIGLWIVLTKESYPEDKIKMVSDAIFEELEFNNLCPLCGYGLTFTRFINRKIFE